MITAALERLLAPADGARRLALIALGPVARALVRDRELRVATAGVSVALFALLGAALFPLALLALGPMLFGVPHLVADVRYLVVRPGLHTRRPLAILALPLLAVGLGAPAWVGLVAPLLAALLARGPAPRRASIAALAALALLGVAALGPSGVLLVVHGHNLVAVGLWWAWRRRERHLHLVPLAAMLLGAAVIGAGLLDGAAGNLAGLFPPGLGLEDHAAALAPSTWAEAPATRLVILYAYAQAVHYGIWLRLVPDDDRPRPAPRPFAASYRVLLRELGAGGVALGALLAAGLGAWAMLDIAAARAGYLQLAAFHGHLEFAAIALAAAESRRVAWTG